jgi:hypothetical protein
MLRARLPGSHSCIEEWLLLQGQSGRLPQSWAVGARPGPDAGAAGGDGYEAACAAFVARWGAPARYCRLNALEKVGGRADGRRSLPARRAETLRFHGVAVCGRMACGGISPGCLHTLMRLLAW